MSVVNRAMPNLSRPRLRTEAEMRLADLELRSAASYTEIEAVTEDLKQLAIDLDAVPLVTDEWDDASMVYRVEEVQKHTTMNED